MVSSSGAEGGEGGGPSAWDREGGGSGELKKLQKSSLERACGRKILRRRPWGRQIGKKVELFVRAAGFRATDVRNPLILGGFTAQD